MQFRQNNIRYILHAHYVLSKYTIMRTCFPFLIHEIITPKTLSELRNLCDSNNSYRRYSHECQSDYAPGKSFQMNRPVPRTVPERTHYQRLVLPKQCFCLHFFLLEADCKRGLCTIPSSRLCSTVWSTACTR